MPKLANIKHEQFCKTLVKENGHQAKSYKKIYPTVKDNTSRVNSSALMHREDIRTRVYEILDSSKETSVEGLLEKMAVLTKANKEIVCDKDLVEVRDNPTRMESIKTLLKIRGVMNNSDAVSITNATQLNFNVLDETKLSNIANNLVELNQKLETKKEKYDAPD